MTVWKLTAFAVVAAVLAAMLKKERADFALLMQVAAAGAILWSIASAASSVFRSLLGLAEESGLGDGYLRILLRALCMAVAGEWAAAFCRDAGMSAMAVAVETATGVLLLALCLPLMENAVRFAAGFFV